MREQLILAARNLCRSVYASHPWGYRVANLLFQLKFGGTSEDLGKVTYGCFLIYGVQGMPETPFIPKTFGQIDRLPRGYGAEFGKHLTNILKKYARSNSDLDDLSSRVWLKILSSGQTLKSSLSGVDLERAEKQIVKLVYFIALDWQDHVKLHRHKDIDEPGVIDLGNPDTWAEVGNSLPEKEIDEIRRELSSLEAKVPDIQLYFDLLLDGFRDYTIINEHMLPAFKNIEFRNWQKNYRPLVRETVKKVLEKHF